MDTKLELIDLITGIQEKLTSKEYKDIVEKIGEIKTKEDINLENLIACIRYETTRHLLRNLLPQLTKEIIHLNNQSSQKLASNYSKYFPVLDTMELQKHKKNTIIYSILHRKYFTEDYEHLVEKKINVRILSKQFELDLINRFE